MLCWKRDEIQHFAAVEEHDVNWMLWMCACGYKVETYSSHLLRAPSFVGIASRIPNIDMLNTLVFLRCNYYCGRIPSRFACMPICVPWMCGVQSTCYNKKFTQNSYCTIQSRHDDPAGSWSNFPPNIRSIQSIQSTARYLWSQFERDTRMWFIRIFHFHFLQANSRIRCGQQFPNFGAT